jgi:hypothetical protein
MLDVGKEREGLCPLHAVEIANHKPVAPLWMTLVPLEALRENVSFLRVDALAANAHQLARAAIEEFQRP